MRTESAGGVVLNALREIALVRNGHESDWWGFPKGHIDEGEDDLAAALREINEETGLSVLALVRKLETYERFKGGPDGKEDTSELKVIHMYLFTTEETALQPLDPQNPEARWVSIERVEEMLAHQKDKDFFRRVRDGL